MPSDGIEPATSSLLVTRSTILDGMLDLLLLPTRFGVNLRATRAVFVIGCCVIAYLNIWPQGKRSGSQGLQVGPMGPPIGCWHVHST